MWIFVGENYLELLFISWNKNIVIFILLEFQKILKQGTRDNPAEHLWKKFQDKLFVLM